MHCLFIERPTSHSLLLQCLAGAQLCFSLCDVNKLNICHVRDMRVTVFFVDAYHHVHIFVPVR